MNKNNRNLSSSKAIWVLNNKQKTKTKNHKIRTNYIFTFAICRVVLILLRNWPNSLSVCLSGCSSACLSAWSSVITFRNLTFFAVCGSLSAELVLSTCENLALVSFLSYVQISLTLRHNYKLCNYRTVNESHSYKAVRSGHMHPYFTLISVQGWPWNSIINLNCGCIGSHSRPYPQPQTRSALRWQHTLQSVVNLKTHAHHNLNRKYITIRVRVTDRIHNRQTMGGEIKSYKNYLQW